MEIRPGLFIERNQADIKSGIENAIGPMAAALV
jgi:hypothetical protein